MKRLLSIIISSIIIIGVAAVPAYAETSAEKTTDDGVYTYEVVNDKYVRLVKCLSTENAVLNDDGSYTIPSEIEGKPVKYLGKSLFRNYDVPAEKVIVPDTVTHIESRAFFHAKYVEVREADDVYGWYENDTILSDIKLSKNLGYIGYGAFKDVENLTDITLPDSLVFIDSYAFYGTGISSLVLPENIREIRNNAFSHCTDLTKVDVEAPLTTIPVGLFSSCKKLSEITLPKTIKKIESYALNGTNLKALTIDDDVQIEDFAFSKNCSVEIDFTKKDLSCPQALGNLLKNEIPVTYNLPASEICLRVVAGMEFKLGVKGHTATKWKSDDNNIIKIENDGSVVVMGWGYVNATAMLEDGTKCHWKLRIITSPYLKIQNEIVPKYSNQKYYKIKKGKTLLFSIVNKAKSVDNVYKGTKYAKFIGKSNKSFFNIKGVKKGKSTVRVWINGMRLSIKIKVI